MTVGSNHEELVAAARRRRDAQLPKEYIIPKDKLPPADQTCVIDYARTSGLFSDEELQITEVCIQDVFCPGVSTPRPPLQLLRS